MEQCFEGVFFIVACQVDGRIASTTRLDYFIPIIVKWGPKHTEVLFASANVSQVKRVVSDAVIISRYIF